MRCWAESIGGCSRQQSREHVFSESLIKGDFVTIRGFSWCRLKPKTIGKASAVARVLCTTHNRQLSCCDEEAKALKNLLIRAKDKNRKEQTSHSINGNLFARWICKTACGVFASEGRSNDNDLVRLAFGKPTKAQYYLYLAIDVDVELKVNLGVVHFEELMLKDASDATVLWMSFYGIDWCLANQDIRGKTCFAKDLQYLDQSYPLDRTIRITFTSQPFQTL